MLSQVVRRELAQDVIVVSIVYPSVTATEFHQSLAAGGRVGRRFVDRDCSHGGVGGRGNRRIESGEEEVMLTQGWDQGAPDRRDTGQTQ